MTCRLGRRSSRTDRRECCRAVSRQPTARYKGTGPSGGAPPQAARGFDLGRVETADETSDAPAAAVELGHSQLERLARVYDVNAGDRRISERLRALAGRLTGRPVNDF